VSDFVVLYADVLTELAHSLLKEVFSRGRDGQSKSHKTEFRQPSQRTLVDGV